MGRNLLGSHHVLGNQFSEPAHLNNFISLICGYDGAQLQSSEQAALLVQLRMMEPGLVSFADGV